jgi:hypothetical protein
MRRRTRPAFSHHWSILHDAPLGHQLILKFNPLADLKRSPLSQMTILVQIHWPSHRTRLDSFIVSIID